MISSYMKNTNKKVIYEYEVLPLPEAYIRKDHYRLDIAAFAQMLNAKGGGRWELVQILVEPTDPTLITPPGYTGIFKRRVVVQGIEPPPAPPLRVVELTPAKAKKKAYTGGIVL